MALYIVEAQLSDAGLRPATVAQRHLGIPVVFVTNRLDRYRGLSTFQDVLLGPDCRILGADTNDADAVAAAIRSDPEATDGVYTMCDYNLPIVAAVAAQLGLPGLSPEAAAACRNKLRTREALRAAGLSTPRYANPRSLDELDTALATVGLPCVIKPMTESASVDVRLCYSHDDAVRHFTHIAGRPRDARGQPRPPGALVEEYLVGFEVSVETVRHGNDLVVLGVTDKQLSPAPVFAEIADLFPSLLPEPIVQACAAAAGEGLAAVGHDFGCAHTEIRVVDGEPVIVEINARLAGDDIPDLIKLSTGIDILEQSVRMHVGQVPQLTRVCSRAASAHSLIPWVGGVVTAVRGLEVARRVSGVVHAEVSLRAGDLIEAATSNHAAYGHVVAAADSAAEAWRLADFAASQIFVELEPAAATDTLVTASAKGLDPT